MVVELNLMMMLAMKNKIKWAQHKGPSKNQNRKALLSTLLNNMFCPMAFE
jgi:hypothetical protein